MKEGGGREESTILGFGGKVPAWMAAFANGAMVHCLDYDDIHHHARGHLSSQTVPAGFAVAERIGNVKGRDFITAIALGNDIMARLCSSVPLKYMWHRTPLFGVFGSATASGKLLGLNSEQIVDALGLAFCQAAGTMELRVGVGSDIGGMRDAFPNKGGVFAALLAQKGIHGVRTCFEGKAGMFNVYFGGEYDRNIITADLGKVFYGTNIGFKPWPACAVTHPYIEATLALVNEYNVSPEDVKEVTVFVGETSQNLCQPLEARRKPATTMDAKYSIPFSVAVAIVRRRVGIDDFAVEGLKDRAVLEVAQKVTSQLDARYDPGRGTRPAKVAIKMKNGREYSRHIDVPYGHPEKPMSWDDIVSKFKDCLSHAVKPVPGDSVEQVIHMISHLETVEDTGQIVRLLA